MGIFNGSSIYNYGAAGGGGYNDGGQIVDGDFMKIENNAVSTYNNVNRDTLNFYLEPSDGEILNAVVELTTAVNSTVNVYVLRNGLYYLLNISGLNTVSSGNEYKVNIIGNSYAIENVTVQNPDPELAVINGTITKITKNNNLYWSDFLVVDSSEYYNNTIGQPGRFYRIRSITNEILPNLSDGWRPPTKTEVEYLVNNYTSPQLRSVTPAWSAVPPGTNESGLNFKPFGLSSGYESLYWVNESCSCFMNYWDGRYRFLDVGRDVYGNDSLSIGNNNDDLFYSVMRVVHDA